MGAGDSSGLRMVSYVVSPEQCHQLGGVAVGGIHHSVD